MALSAVSECLPMGRSCCRRGYACIVPGGRTMTKWTEAQQDAISARHGTLLVSAAAGSGKTAVLVERIVSKVVREHADIDRILVVTFTKAAAAQMKQRIGAAIEKQLAEDPSNEHLQRQSALVHHAPISTIDSFCLDVVRSYIHHTDLDPEFRVADDGEIKLLEHDVYARLKEQCYAEKDPEFLHLVDSLEPQLREENLENCVLTFFHYSQAYPWPSEWRAHSLQSARVKDAEELEETEWIRYLVQYITRQAADAASSLRACQEKATVHEDRSKGYGPKLGAEAQALEQIARASSYRELYESTRVQPWVRLGKVKDDDPESYEKAKIIRNRWKDRINLLIERYVSLSPEDAAVLTAAAFRCASALAGLTDRFEEEFSAQKRERGIVDFSDIEHMALQVLLDRSGEGEIRPSAAAAEYAAAFDEVMIDEYQDSNEVQELLLRAVSGEWNASVPNRFMVGDVKQSIYRFRQAMPELFMEKYRSYETAKDNAYRKIELNANFRSRPEVLEAVNMVFSQIMRSELGGIDYDENAALHPGAAYPALPDGNGSANEIWLVSGNSSDENEEELTNSDMREARVTAARIKAMMEKETVWDAENQCARPLRYGDIAILLRSVKGHADIWLDALEEAGIPAYTGSGTGYFSAPEVRLVMSYLHVLDNPRQDIPLAAVLRSPMGGLTEGEIAQIRLQGSGSVLWDDLQAYIESVPDEAMAGGQDVLSFQASVKKLKAFIVQTNLLRRDAALLPMHDLIWRLITQTGYLDYVTAMPAGAQRRANLLMLAERASAFEKGSFRGLFHFLRYIETLQSYDIDYGEAPLSGENADTVQIMSIHKSKGLEFPVTIVCGLGRKFNQREAAGQMVLHSRLGMGLKTVDPARHVELASPLHGAIGLRALEDAKGEELRILYVAATRAREKLVLIGSASLPEGEDAEKDAGTDLYRWYGQAEEAEEKVFGTGMLQGCHTPLDFLVPAALRHPAAAEFLNAFGLPGLEAADAAAGQKSGFMLRAVSGTEEDSLLADLTVKEADHTAADLFRIEEGQVYDEEIEAEYKELSEAAYPHAELSGIRAKVSVSYLKEKAYEEEQERVYQLLQDRSSGEGEISSASEGSGSSGRTGGAERGTLYHSFMEHMTMQKADSPSFFEGQLETMINCGKMPSDARVILRGQDFMHFFASELYNRMCRAASAGRLHREAPFVLGEKAVDLKSEWNSEETVLVQGIIDAWFTDEDGQIVLLDYKTDRVPNGDETSLIRKYSAQLDIYAKALERLTERKVKEKLIWSFALNKVVELPVSPD